MGTGRAGSANEDEENCFKAVTMMTDDRINEMPDDILSLILSFLTIRDAIKAKLLSRRWRYLCPSTTNFHLDLYNISGMTYDYIYLRKNSDKLCEGKLRFVRTVDQILQFYRIPDISSFKVCYWLGNEFASHIDRWISYAVGKQTKKLDLNFSFIPEDCEDKYYLDYSFIPQDCELYSFPFQLLSRDKSSQLKHLGLHACRLRLSPDFTNCLRSLNTLELNKVPVVQNVFDNILSGCSNLKWLTLKRCRLPVKFFIRGQNIYLERLVLEHCCGAITVKLSSIDVTTFECTNMQATFELNIVGVASVKNLHLRLMQEGKNDMLNRIAEDFPQLENLLLNLETYQVKPIVANMTKFSHLKTLELIVILSLNFDLLSVASVLNASPCLQKFHLALQCEVESEKVKWEYSKQLYYHLKEVEISGFHEPYNPLGLAIYLLNSAVGLERMIIDTRGRAYFAARRWDYRKNPIMNEADKQRVLSVLQREKAKPDVEIIVI